VHRRATVVEVGRKTGRGNPQRKPQAILSLPGCCGACGIPSLPTCPR
jgi:hypothetical protein